MGALEAVEAVEAVGAVGGGRGGQELAGRGWMMPAPPLCWTAVRHCISIPQGWQSLGAQETTLSMHGQAVESCAAAASLRILPNFR